MIWSLCFLASLVGGVRGDYASLAAAVPWDQVVMDITEMLTTSSAAWPADYGNYGPFMIRHAWHCAGSYRISDGRGGCGGGRQRFEPERSWEDNTNLDKAKTLLWPIKHKYGDGLSWGDLIILAGNTAIQSMGGPVLGFCAGRVDDLDGSASDLLGPTAEQDRYMHCEPNGQCLTPLGPTTVGLIYVNPEGPMGEAIPEGSFPEIRDTFGRMAMDDSETVALIGGGHAFGKTHGACPDGPGPSPKEDPLNPWPGACGDGIGDNQFTSGFEGPWVTDPTRWSNDYFTLLRDHSWRVRQGPGGHSQWETNSTSPQARGAHGGAAQNIMMLTSDVSLLHDPAYAALVDKFADDLGALDDAFSHAWYKLTTRDMGPITRCIHTDLLPPAQPFQHPLPAPGALPNFGSVRTAIRTALRTAQPEVIDPDEADGAYYGAMFMKLAWQCAKTFRSTDYLGGCNGARIRFANQSTWQENVAMDEVLALLSTVKDQFGDELSWADLIVLAGHVAVEDAGGRTMTFCGGRTDASEGSGSQDLEPLPTRGELTDLSYAGWELKEQARLLGLSMTELTAVMGQMRSDILQKRAGFKGSWGNNPAALSNAYHRVLLDNTWQPDADGKEFKAEAGNIWMLKHDIALLLDPEFAAIVAHFAMDNEAFLDAFASGFSKLMTNDRYDGPTGNVCASDEPTPAPPQDSDYGLGVVIGVGVGGFAVGAAILCAICLCVNRKQGEYNTF